MISEKSIPNANMPEPEIQTLDVFWCFSKI